MNTSGRDFDQPKQVPQPRWFRALIVLVCVLLPATLAKGWIEIILGHSEAIRLLEPEGAVRTPNPAKAPWAMHGESLMVYYHPRLANWAYRWKYLPFLVALLSARILPLLVVRRIIMVPLSLAIGLLMAWPWLMFLSMPFWEP